MWNGQSPVIVRSFERVVRLAGMPVFQHLTRRFPRTNMAETG
jgi:hypothetical protein